VLAQALTPDAVAGAVQAHGLGLLPAAVNAAYKFLAARMAALSQVGACSLCAAPAAACMGCELHSSVMQACPRRAACRRRVVMCDEGAP
jgi:hypothetical protein